MSDEEVLTQYSTAPLDLEELLKMYRANPENVNILDCLAFKYYTANDLEKALDFYKKILLIEPDNVNALYYIGNIYYRQKKLVNAIIYWKKVVAQEGADPKMKEKAEGRLSAAMEQMKKLG